MEKKKGKVRKLTSDLNMKKAEELTKEAQDLVLKEMHKAVDNILRQVSVQIFGEKYTKEDLKRLTILSPSDNIWEGISWFKIILDLGTPGVMELGVVKYGVNIKEGTVYCNFEPSTEHK